MDGRRRVLKVILSPEPGNDYRDAATIAIQANNFFHTEIGDNQFLVMTPSENYGGEREMQDDLNDNAIGGTYRVVRATPDELEEFDRTDGHLHN